MKQNRSNHTQYYQIRIDGHLDQFHGGLEEMTISLLPEGQTLISGVVKDQSELFGILIRIRDMGIPLISVNRTSVNRKERSEVT